MTSIALLIPCFNAVRYLLRLKRQIERLNTPFDQVLLVDDGSSDETYSVARELGFDIIRLPTNVGPGGARNVLASSVQQTWIHFHDVDDEIAANYRERVGEALSADVDLIFHFVDFLEEESRRPFLEWRFDADAMLRRPAAELLRRPMGVWSSVIRRSVFQSCGGFNERYRCFEDGDLHFRLAARGARIALVPEVLETSLRHGNGASRDQRYCFECRVDLLEQYSEEFGDQFNTEIAAEAERAAVQALRLGDRVTARRAVALAEALGSPIPTSNNAIIRLARRFCSPIALLAIQDRWRRLAS